MVWNAPAPSQAYWDYNTQMPIGGAYPRGRNALDYQAYAEQMARQRANQLWDDSQRSLQQAEQAFGTYRPSGGLLMRSGLYQNRASLYAQQAQNVQAPDLLAGYREDVRLAAERRARRAARRARTGQIIAGVAAVAATALTAGAAAPVAGAIVGAAGSALGNAVGGGGESIMQPGGDPLAAGQQQIQLGQGMSGQQQPQQQRQPQNGFQPNAQVQPQQQGQLRQPLGGPVGQMGFDQPEQQQSQSQVYGEQEGDSPGGVYGGYSPDQPGGGQQRQPGQQGQQGGGGMASMPGLPPAWSKMPIPPSEVAVMGDLGMIQQLTGLNGDPLSYAETAIEWSDELEQDDTLDLFEGKMRSLFSGSGF